MSRFLNFSLATTKAYAAMKVTRIVELSVNAAVSTGLTAIGV